MTELYIGLMSGTSADGIDACLVNLAKGQCHIIDFYYLPFNPSLKSRIIKLSQADRPIFLAELGEIDSILGQLFASATVSLLENNKLTASDIAAIGSHGLTVHHAPNGSHPFSLQIGDPNIIAEHSGITTIADFRRRDIAAKGQGAPLAPAFHRHFFTREHKKICVVNIGGIANLTVLHHDKTIGFDTGPGNTLMDYWIHKHRGENFDRNGDWAKNGSCINFLLSQFKQDEYLLRPPPKSTGKEHFSSTWLKEHLKNTDYPPQQVQATLCQFTADTITAAINQYAPETEMTVICGGGSHNKNLLWLLQQKLSHPVTTSSNHGIDPDHVEAAAFAWLAHQTLHNQFVNLEQITGATHSVILGGIYPGKRGLLTQLN